MMALANGKAETEKERSREACTMKQYEVRYGTPVNFKVVKTEYRDRAEGVFGTAKRFAEKHNLNWTVAIWNDGYLEKSIEINPA